MERFGEDVEKKFITAGRRFSLKTVCYLALQLVSIIRLAHTNAAFYFCFELAEAIDCLHAWSCKQPIQCMHGQLGTCLVI